jgi:hypothetical protein
VARAKGSSTCRAAAIALATVAGCSIGSNTGETFGPAASVGGNTQGDSGTAESGEAGSGSDEQGPATPTIPRRVTSSATASTTTATARSTRTSRW